MTGNNFSVAIPFRTVEVQAIIIQLRLKLIICRLAKCIGSGVGDSSVVSDSAPNFERFSGKTKFFFGILVSAGAGYRL